VVAALTSGLGAKLGFEYVEKPQVQSAIAHAIQKRELACQVIDAIHKHEMPWLAIDAIHNVRVLVENKEIESAMVRKIPHIADWIRSGMNKADVARGIMPIKVLRENKAIQEAIREGELRDGFY